jgi:hypothetical protein
MADKSGSSNWRSFAGWFAVYALLVSAVVTSVGRNEPVQNEPQPQTALVAPVPEVTLSCEGDKEYLPLPAVQEIVLVVNPTGETCWTAWLIRPARARYLSFAPERDVEMEMAFGEGQIVKRHDSPLSRWWDGRLLNGARYQNLSNKRVRIPVTISY